MEFLKSWRKKNAEANAEARRRLQSQNHGSASDEMQPVPGPSGIQPKTSHQQQAQIPKPNDPKPGTSHHLEAERRNDLSGQIDQQSTSPSDIIYENEDLKMIVKKGFHQRQKNFKLQVSNSLT